MPYDAYAEMTDDDVHALYACFMQEVKPVDDEPVDRTALPFPFNIRQSMIIWNMLYATKGAFEPDPTKSDELNRGAYVASALGHCSSCHTPRGPLMGEDSSRYLAGGAVGPWYAPNITSDPVSGIGGWSNDELVQYFRTGHVDGKNQAAGGMAEAVQNSLQHLPESDLKALAAYLKSVPPIRETTDKQSAQSFGPPQARTRPSVASPPQTPMTVCALVLNSIAATAPAATSRTAPAARISPIRHCSTTPRQARNRQVISLRPSFMVWSEMPGGAMC